MGCISAFVCILAYNLNNTLCTYKWAPTETGGYVSMLVMSCMQA